MRYNNCLPKALRYSALAACLAVTGIAAKESYEQRIDAQQELQSMESFIRMKREQTDKVLELLPQYAKENFQRGKYVELVLLDPKCGFCVASKQAHEDLGSILKDNQYVTVAEIPDMDKRHALAEALKIEGYPAYSLHRPDGEQLRIHSGSVGKDNQLEHIIWNINYDLESQNASFRLNIQR